MARDFVFVLPCAFVHRNTNDDARSAPNRRQRDDTAQIGGWHIRVLRHVRRSLRIDICFADGADSVGQCARRAESRAICKWSGVEVTLVDLQRIQWDGDIRRQSGAARE